MNIPKISIIIPVYNVEDFLCECLDSVIKQTLHEIEIICINDGSTDNSKQILEIYKQNDNRIRIIDKQNGGYGQVINIGLITATGEYIGILEADDYVLPQMYELLYKAAESTSHSVDFVRSDHIQFIEDENGQQKYINSTRKEYYNRIIKPRAEPNVFTSHPVNCTGIYKRSFVALNMIRLNESPGASFQDNGLCFQLFFFAEKIYFINKAFYMYRRDRGDSSINDMSYQKAFCIFSEYEFIYQLMCQHNERKKSYLDLFTLRCTRAFSYQGERISTEYKAAFFIKYSQVLNELKGKNELVTNLLSTNEVTELELIMSDPVDYYYKKYARKTYYENVTNRGNGDNLAKIKGVEVQSRKANNNSDRNYSFITGLLYRVKAIRDCIYDHGIIYTISYAFHRISKRK